MARSQIITGNKALARELYDRFWFFRKVESCRNHVYFHKLGEKFSNNAFRFIFRVIFKIS